jgi:hypothetical protein
MCKRNQYYVDYNSSGYQTKESFEVMFRNHYIPLLLQRREQLGINNKKILIILDSHSSRLNRNFYIYCNTLNINFLTIPAHCSHFLQPLDVTVNGIFKSSLPRLYIPPHEASLVYSKKYINIIIKFIHLFYLSHTAKYQSGTMRCTPNSHLFIYESECHQKRLCRNRDP